MVMLIETPTNKTKVHQVKNALAALMNEALRQGFYGTIGLEIVVQNGTIQQLSRRVERLER